MKDSKVIEQSPYKDLQKIIRINDILSRQASAIPAEPGLYAFWWIGPKSLLMSSNRILVLKGPGGAPVKITWQDWWPNNLEHPCLYVGKSTNLKHRFMLHLKTGSPGRLHRIPHSNKKARPVTTSCQVRYGVEHLFKRELHPLQLIQDNIGFSYQIHGLAADVIERFYTEDKLIGLWRPWFNIDSER